MDVFAVLADPTRRDILDLLRSSDRNVGQLVTALGVAQPALSKHLRVLREAGFVSYQVAAQQRIYRIEQPPLRALDSWITPYRLLWTHVDALERPLDPETEAHQ